MDGQQFDRLTQGFSRALSRRRFGAVLAMLGLGAGVAAPKIKAKKKKKKKKRPKPCAAGTARCGAACVDTQSNAQHCGGCGQACPGGQACSGGQCQGGNCPGDQARCGGTCVNLDTDEAHCGGCGRACNGDLTCQNGVCGCGSETQCGNQCVDTQTNRNHCGGCDDACNGTQICSGGECVEPPECTSQAQCGGSGSFNDLVCRNGRCVCADEAKGICQRFPDGRGSCHRCCPGGTPNCLGDRVCTVWEPPSGGVAAACLCPNGERVCNTDSNRCVGDPNFDSRKCGLDCVDCTTRNPGSSCCNGGCARGCDPGTQCGGINGPCGANCSMCGPGTICCNNGPGSSSQCIPNRNGFCYVT